MAIFLIDYENVSSAGLDGLETRAEQDRVCIFYTENADRLTFDAHRRLMESGAQVSYHKVESGSKNALDFQLSSYLGYLIHGAPEESYYIISKDSGFDSVLRFWTKESIRVERMPNLDVEHTSQANDELRQKLLELLDDGEVAVVFEMIQKYKTKQGLNNALIKQFENKKTSESYRIIKPYIAKLKSH